MKSKTNCTSSEEIILNRIENILERLPNKGEKIDLEYVSNECKKIEVCSSIA